MISPNRFSICFILWTHCGASCEDLFNSRCGSGQVCLSTPVYMDGAFREATDQTENTDETKSKGLSSTGGSLLEWFLPSGFMSQRWDCPVCRTDSRQTRAVGVDLQCCQSKICRTCLEAIVSTKCKLCPQCGEQLCALDICAGMMSTQQWIEADTDNAEKRIKSSSYHVSIAARCKRRIQKGLNSELEFCLDEGRACHGRIQILSVLAGLHRNRVHRAES